MTQQTKPSYKYFSNERTMEEAKSKVTYYDQVCIFSLIFYIFNDPCYQEYQKEYDKSQILFGMTLGSTAEDSTADDDGPSSANSTAFKSRVRASFSRVPSNNILTS